MWHQTPGAESGACVPFSLGGCGAAARLFVSPPAAPRTSLGRQLRCGSCGRGPPPRPPALACGTPRVPPSGVPPPDRPHTTQQHGNYISLGHTASLPSRRGGAWAWLLRRKGRASRRAVRPLGGPSRSTDDRCPPLARAARPLAAFRRSPASPIDGAHNRPRFLDPPSAQPTPFRQLRTLPAAVRSPASCSANPFRSSAPLRALPFVKIPAPPTPPPLFRRRRSISAADFRCSQILQHTKHPECGTLCPNVCPGDRRKGADMRRSNKIRLSVRLPQPTVDKLAAVGAAENRGLSNTIDTLLLRGLELTPPPADYRQPPRPASRRSKA